MEDDWDLHAVVRSCTAASTPMTTTTTATATATTTAVTASSSGPNTNTTTCSPVFSTFRQEYNFSTSSFQDLIDIRRGSFIEELHDLYKPFFPKSHHPPLPVISSHNLPISPLSVLGGLQDLSSDQQPQQQQLMKQLPEQTLFKPKQQPFSVVNGSKPSVSHNPSSRSKRRKNNFKKVCHVPAEGLSSDMWSWRKYGQKPIKGSPYPRGYYKCSTSKGCLARKQVERNRSDPGMFIVTYTAEHNHPMPTHRNSLAGSTRQKLEETPNSDDPKKPSSPEMSPAPSLSPALEKLESSREDLPEAEEEEDDFSVSNMAVDDDFFEGLEDFTGPEGGECFFDHFPASLAIPCVAKSATTAAGSG